MSILKKIKQIVQQKKSHQQSDEASNNVVLSEDEFYKKLFTEDPLWNSSVPNAEEETRWRIIEQFLVQVKDFYKNKIEKEIAILDLGCGRGWLTKLLSNHGTAMGIEPVRPVVEYANKIFPELNIINGTSKDLLQRGFKNKFDLVVSSEVIEHVPDEFKDGFIHDIKELLTENGFAIITTPRKEVEKEWLKYCNENQPVEDWITEAQLESYFKSQKFTPLSHKRFSIKPLSKAPEIEIYQLWLFQKN